MTGKKVNHRIKKNPKLQKNTKKELKKSNNNKNNQNKTTKLTGKKYQCNKNNFSMDYLL